MMDPVFVCTLLLLSFSGTSSKYVYIEEKMPWDKALSYCQQNYTDLAPVSNEQDNLKLQELSHNLNDYIWFGLLRNLSDKNKWLWSGGGEVTELCWKQGQPENRLNEDYGLFDNKKWRDAHADIISPVFCYSAVVVEEEKTWEEALEYCREHHDDLASVASETEMLLIQKELNKYHTTNHVWIGLRFLSKDWLWVDGQEMDYEAWDVGGKPLCPQAKMKCAALQKTGGRLSSWRAHDCEKRLSFICY